MQERLNEIQNQAKDDLAKAGSLEEIEKIRPDISVEKLALLMK